jgi:hypothetical protein
MNKWQDYEAQAYAAMEQRDYRAAHHAFTHAIRLRLERRRISTLERRGACDAPRWYGAAPAGVGRGPGRLAPIYVLFYLILLYPLFLALRVGLEPGASTGSCEATR